MKKTGGNSAAPQEVSVAKAILAASTDELSTTPDPDADDDDTLDQSMAEFQKVPMAPTGAFTPLPQPHSGEKGRRIQLLEDSSAPPPPRLNPKKTLKVPPASSAQSVELLSVHPAGSLVAMGIGDLILVVSMESGESLELDCADTRLCDLSFARLTNRFLLAASDEAGGLHVSELAEESDDFGSIRVASSFSLVHEVGTVLASRWHSISWCPYMPESAQELKEIELGSKQSDWNPALVLAIAHNSVVEVLRVDEVAAAYGRGRLEASEVLKGRLQTTSLGGPLSSVRMSPAGSTLAVTMAPQQTPMGKKPADQISFMAYNFKVAWVLLLDSLRGQTFRFFNI